MAKVKIVTKPIVKKNETSVKLVTRTNKAETKKTYYIDLYPTVKHPVTGKPVRRFSLGIVIELNPSKTQEEVNDDNKEAAENLYKEIKEMTKNNDFSYLGIVEENEDFVTYIRKRQKSKEKSVTYSTQLSYNSLVSNLKEFAPDGIPIETVDHNFINAFQNYLLERKKPIDKTTVKYYTGLIKHICKYAYAEDFIPALKRC